MLKPIELIEKSLNGQLTMNDALSFLVLGEEHLHDILFIGSTIRVKYFGSTVNACSIVNAKSGLCSEDCKYCAQSAKHCTGIEEYGLLSAEEIIEKARLDMPYASHFGIVTSGRRLESAEIKAVGDTIQKFNHAGIKQIACASLGILDADELRELKKAGLARYHHNVETSRNHFRNICTTHSYDERIATINAAKEAGLEICVGGIFGLGESIEDRAGMLFEVCEIAPDSVPLNFLVPVKGTALGDRPLIPRFEAVKIIALARMLMPQTNIKVCGGRIEVFGDSQELVFLAGATSIITGDMLTVKGRTPADDDNLISDLGLVKL